MKITLKLINSFYPCYNPEEIGFTSKMSLTPVELIDQFKNKVKNNRDIIWLLCRKEFMTDRDLRLFAVWCAREALKLVGNPDKRSINACDVAEKYANDEATREELGDAAWAAWIDATAVVAWTVVDVAKVAEAAQIEKLKEYFLK